MLAFLHQRCGVHEVETGNPDLVLEVMDLPGPTPSRAARVPQPGFDLTWDGTRHHFVRDGFELELETQPDGHARATCRCSPTPLLPDQALRLCLSVLLPLRGSLMLHGSAAARDGRGYLFTGPSGSGKSTTLKLLADVPRVRAIGDEIVVVHVATGEATVGSTPFSDLPSRLPAEAPLVRAFVLVPPSAPPSSRKDCLTRLLPNVLTHGGSPEVVQSILRNAEALIGRVDFRELYRPTREQLAQALQG
ncbi:MAG: hypothetical protein HY906_17240 [Deltaproteobacteria bacterium]|nr:hypothetical protein [Deltaproteobacteria bacterium]